MRLRVRRQHSMFWPILTRLVDYYSPFWCPEVISIVVESQGALTCRSSTLAVLADSGPFLRVLLSFGGPGVISTINELNPGVRLCAGQQHSQFLSILPRFMAYYSLF